ncbi:ABC transporter permease [Alkalibacterium sp. MB6]|uniref:ABC transporter permease n=1 Tax=Alkalibacterium sp. MB6 TaxID=2081965 RepID=UPI00137AF822|nr:ABC transporter permease [Alkalibacterium sp. MB6]
MTTDHLFKRRRQVYYKKLGKYLKYVLNDHFVLALLLLFGALGFTYSEYVETVNLGAVLPRLVLLVILIGVLTIGRVRTLIEPADSVFLLPLEEELEAVMKGNLVFSVSFFSIFMMLVGFMSLPLLTVTLAITQAEAVMWVVTLVCWKASQLMSLYNEGKQKDYVVLRQSFIFLASMGLIISLFLSIVVGFVLSVATVLGLIWFSFYYEKTTRWDFEYLIESESKRVNSLYRLLNLFVETPYHSNKVRRFKWLDGLFSSRFTDASPTIFYLARVFIRNTSFSGLYLRLTVIGGIVIVFTDSLIINLLISILFLYLIGFQLLPLNQMIQQSITFRLYPLSNKLRERAIQQLLLYLLLAAGLVFFLLALNSGVVEATVLVLINLVFILGFIYVYVPKRLRKKA